MNMLNGRGLQKRRTKASRNVLAVLASGAHFAWTVGIMTK